MTKYYLLGPVLSLAEKWPEKLVVSVTATIAATILDRAVDVYGTLLDVNEVLLVMAATIFLLDLASGLYRAARSDSEDLSILKLKMTGFKMVEWGLLILGSIIVSNGAAEYDIPYLSQLHVGMIFWLSLTDLFSILANIKGSEDKAADWLSGAQKILRGEISVDDLKGETEPNNSS